MQVAERSAAKLRMTRSSTGQRLSLSQWTSNQWLEDAAAAPGDAAWPSPEQHAEAQMDPLMVSQFPRQVYIAQIAQYRLCS